MTEYYLIDKYTDNIISKHSAESDEDARMYFIHRKLMVDKEKAFDGIWNVVSKKEYEEELIEFGSSIKNFYIYCENKFGKRIKKLSKRGRPKKLMNESIA